MDDKPHNPLKFQTLAAQFSGAMVGPDTGMVPPIHLSTMYTRDENHEYSSGYVYGRADNPTLRQTEAQIASLEGGRSAMLFGSGMASAMSVVMAFEQPMHVIASADMYYSLKKWFRGLGRFGHTVAFVDTTNLASLREAIAERVPALIWIETPSNPLWSITDIEAVANIARKAKAILCVDSTVATPVFSHPLDLGAHLVMHSATKYLNGHADVSAGALITDEPSDIWMRIADMRAEQGISLGAMEAWLLSRGLRTLDIRVRTQARTAAFLAHALQDHPAVSHVLYPGLTTHPGHKIAARQMHGGFGGMLSIRLHKGSEAAIMAAGSTRVWKRATSLGGVESLVEHRATMEGAATACPDDLLRLSVGIEDKDDLLADLERALGLTDGVVHRTPPATA